MKRTAMPIVIVVLLLLGAAALRQAQDVALAQTGGPGPPTWYTVEQGTASGGGYRLTNVGWPVCGTASGGGYQLRGPAAPASSENGCCCVYLPLILRNFQ